MAQKQEGPRMRPFLFTAKKAEQTDATNYFFFFLVAFFLAVFFLAAIVFSFVELICVREKHSTSNISIVSSFEFYAIGNFTFQKKTL
jgi:flagellar biogenesis protein FliO